LRLFRILLAVRRKKGFAPRSNPMLRRVLTIMARGGPPLRALSAAGGPLGKKESAAEAAWANARDAELLAQLTTLQREKHALAEKHAQATVRSAAETAAAAELRKAEAVEQAQHDDAVADFDAFAARRAQEMLDQDGSPPVIPPTRGPRS
jgi:hypothetical protein